MVADEEGDMANSTHQAPAERLSVRLSDTVFRSIQWVAETGSTNADLLAAARDDAPHGSVLVADYQSAGRGRHGRKWLSDRNEALLVSVLLRPVADTTAGWLVSATAIALVDAVGHLGVAAGIKWPNDLVVASAGGHKKLAGILAESSVTNGRVDAVVVGLGCNVAAVPPQARAIATSIHDEAGSTVDRVELLADVLTRLHRRLESDEPIMAAYRSRSTTIGRTVRVDGHHGVVVGTAVDVDDDGRLILATSTGEELISAGDVVHLRPGDGNTER